MDTLRVKGLPSNGRPRRRPRTASGALAFALCALLAGCGGSSNASAPNGGGGASTTRPAVIIPLPADMAQKPACSLVTKAEVEAAIGAKVGAPREEAQAGRSLCSFALASATDQIISIISTSSSGVPKFFADAREKAAGSQTVTAGDQAFVTGGLGLVRRGTTMVTILVALRQDKTQLASAATKLTQAVGARL